MLRTIILGPSIFVQGVFERCLPDGRICVRVGPKVYSGFPVTTAA